MKKKLKLRNVTTRSLRPAHLSMSTDDLDEQIEDLFTDAGWRRDDRGIPIDLGPPKCECGSEHEVGPLHSDWCPRRDDSPREGSVAAREEERKVAQRRSKLK